MSSRGHKPCTVGAQGEVDFERRIYAGIYISQLNAVKRVYVPHMLDDDGLFQSRRRTSSCTALISFYGDIRILEFVSSCNFTNYTELRPPM